MKILLQITVNGIAREEAVAGNTLLIEFLRDTLGLTGTKMGCDGGGLRSMHRAAGWPACPELPHPGRQQTGGAGDDH